MKRNDVAKTQAELASEQIKGQWPSRQTEAKQMEKGNTNLQQKLRQNQKQTILTTDKNLNWQKEKGEVERGGGGGRKRERERR